MQNLDHLPNSTDPILVVDDEKIFLSALRLTLQRAGYEAVACSSPLAALEELEKRKFSVIISDQLMPELSGLELLGKARLIQPFATRILATAVLNRNFPVHHQAVAARGIHRHAAKRHPALSTHLPERAPAIRHAGYERATGGIEPFARTAGAVDRATKQTAW
jgi:CheY-like chemotaxis protein